MRLLKTMKKINGRRAYDNSFIIIGGSGSFHRKLFFSDESDGFQIHCARRKWLFVLLTIFMLHCYYCVVAYYNMLHRGNIELKYLDTGTKTDDVTTNTTLLYYKYPLNGSAGVDMDYKNGYNSSYFWFVSMKPLFINLGTRDQLHLWVRHYREHIIFLPDWVEEFRYEDPSYPNNTLTCQLNESTLGPILVNKTEPSLQSVEQQNPDVKLGGYYAPAHCRATNRVAIIVPYRDRRTNLVIFLRYIHPLLKKQQLEYRVFVVEQYGTEPFNKGTLYNIAFLETQRFGTWHCLIFHDVDLIPEDERISYSCPEHPTHFSVSVEAHGYVLPYAKLFGGVTSLTPEHYTTVNGYSNFYWSWGAEDDDMSVRLNSAGLPMVHYNGSLARYATLSHTPNAHGKYRYFFLDHSKLRYRKEGLTSTKYKLINVTNEKLYTHILADVNPIRMRLHLKSMLRQIVYLFDNSMTYAGVETVPEGGIFHVDKKKTLCHI